MTIPEWDNNKVLPPIHPDAPSGQEYDRLYRSPYAGPLAEFIGRFATTLQRVNMLERFLRYRAALHQAGITEGFQWINGSFVENVEEGPRHRPPGDIDVATFYFLDEDVSPDYTDLFNADLTKENFGVDAYGIQLGEPLSVATATTIGYLNSLWSHRQTDNIWKGFIQADLDPEDDEPARHRLETIKRTFQER